MHDSSFIGLIKLNGSFLYQRKQQLMSSWRHNLANKISASIELSIVSSGTRRAALRLLVILSITYVNMIIYSI